MRTTTQKAADLNLRVRMVTLPEFFRQVVASTYMLDERVVTQGRRVDRTEFLLHRFGVRAEEVTKLTKVVFVELLVPIGFRRTFQSLRWG